MIASVPSDGAVMSAPTDQTIDPVADRVNVPVRSVFVVLPNSRRPLVTTAASNDPSRRARPRSARSPHGVDAVLVSSMNPQSKRAEVRFGTTPARLMPGNAPGLVANWGGECQSWSTSQLLHRRRDARRRKQLQSDKFFPDQLAM